MEFQEISRAYFSSQLHVKHKTSPACVSMCAIGVIDWDDREANNPKKHKNIEFLCKHGKKL